MELIIIPALTTVALILMQAGEYFAARQLEHAGARYPALRQAESAAPSVRRKLTPYVLKPDENSAERAA